MVASESSDGAVDAAHGCNGKVSEAASPKAEVDRPAQGVDGLAKDCESSPRTCKTSCFEVQDKIKGFLLVASTEIRPPSVFDSAWRELAVPEATHAEAGKSDQEGEGEKSTRIDEFIQESIRKFDGSKHLETHESSRLDNVPKQPPTESRAFSVIFGCGIMLNGILMGVEVDHGEANVEIFTGFEHFFCGLFLIEMLMKLWYERRKYFHSGWNIMDCFLVTMTVVDVWILGIIFGPSGFNLSFLRMVRVLRVARMVRFLRMFKELWLIIKGLMDSMKTMLWVSMLLVLILYCFGILFTQTVGQAAGYPPDEETAEEIDAFNNYEHFGTLTRSITTLFLLSITADPSDYWWPIAKHQPQMLLAILLFILITTFALMNVIIGVIVDHTMDAVMSLEKESEDQDMEKAVLVLKVFRDLFLLLDDDHTGHIEFHELERQMKRHEVWSLFQMLNLPFSDPDRLFTLMRGASGDSYVSYKEFFKALLLLRDPDKQKQFANVQVELVTLGQTCLRAQHALEARLQKLENGLRMLQPLNGHNGPARQLPPGSPRSNDDASVHSAARPAHSMTVPTHLRLPAPQADESVGRGCLCPHCGEKLPSNYIQMVEGEKLAPNSGENDSRPDEIDPERILDDESHRALRLALQDLSHQHHMNTPRTSINSRSGTSTPGGAWTPGQAVSPRMSYTKKLSGSPKPSGQAPAALLRDLGVPLESCSKLATMLDGDPKAVVGAAQLLHAVAVAFTRGELIAFLPRLTKMINDDTQATANALGVVGFGDNSAKKLSLALQHNLD